MKKVSCGGILWNTTCDMDDLPQRCEPISRMRGAVSDIYMHAFGTFEQTFEHSTDGRTGGREEGRE
jgi:hypothetical protein